MKFRKTTAICIDQLPESRSPKRSGISLPNIVTPMTANTVMMMNSRRTIFVMSEKNQRFGYYFGVF